MLKLVRDKYEISASFVRDKCEIIRVFNFEITTVFHIWQNSNTTLPWKRLQAR